MTEHLHVLRACYKTRAKMNIKHDRCSRAADKQAKECPQDPPPLAHYGPDSEDKDAFDDKELHCHWR